MEWRIQLSDSKSCLRRSREHGLGLNFSHWCWKYCQIDGIVNVEKYSQYFTIWKVCGWHQLHFSAEQWCTGRAVKTYQQYHSWIGLPNGHIQNQNLMFLHWGHCLLTTTPPCHPKFILVSMFVSLAQNTFDICLILYIKLKTHYVLQQCTRAALHSWQTVKAGFNLYVWSNAHF